MPAWAPVLAIVALLLAACRPVASETIKVGQEPPPRAIAQEQAPVAGQPAAQQAAAPPSAEQGLAQLDFEPEVQADSPSAAPASKPADSPDQTAPAPAAEGAPASAVQPDSANWE